MDLERSVFSISEPKRLYAIGMAVSLLIHVALVVAVVVLPKLTPAPKFADIKAYKVRVVSADQLSGLPQKNVRTPSVSEILATAGSKESRSSREDIPIYSVRKISAPVAEKTSQKLEIKPIESPSPTMATPKPSQQPSAQWEKLLPNISVKKDVPKPIEQRKELLKEPSGSESGAREGSRQSEKSEKLKSQGEEVSGDSKHASSSSSATGGRSDAENKGSSGETGGGSQASEEYGLARKLYYSEVWRAIQSQWAVPSELINRDDLEAILIIKVRRDGTIMDVRFEKKSGNEIFDSSVLRAVQKANPLPPFPKTYSPPYEEIGVRFRPRDLAKR